MRLLGLNGRLHSGKDTVCEMIEDYDKEKMVTRMGFADKLKMSAAWALGFEPVGVDEAMAICNHLKEHGTISTWDEENQQELQIDGRRFLQLYGTEAHRGIFGEDFWVDALLPKDIMFFGEDIVVITDVRFVNEAERILDLDGEIWHIDAEKRLGPLPDDAHESERPLPDHLITWVLDNNGTLPQLRQSIEYGLEEAQAHAN